MKPHLGWIGLTASMLLLSGCFLQQDIKTRECSAFNHPLAKQWQPIESGNSLVLTNADGDSLVYVLSITISEPYVASIDVNSSALDSPVCEMTSTHVFGAEDGSHQIKLNFRQRENDFIPQNSLAMKIDVTLPDTDSGEPGRLLSRTQSVGLINPPSIVDDYSIQPHFISSNELENGQIYSDVIVFPNGSIPSEPEFEQYLISEILLSRTVGLIQFSRNDGTVYTVVPE